MCSFRGNSKLIVWIFFSPPFLNPVSAFSTLSAKTEENIDTILQKCFQCHDTVLLYKLVLRSIQESLKSNKDKNLMREVSMLSEGAVCVWFYVLGNVIREEELGTDRLPKLSHTPSCFPVSLYWISS